MRDIAVAQIDASTKIAIRQRDMIESANGRTMLYSLLWPVSLLVMVAGWWLVKNFDKFTSPSDKPYRTPTEREQYRIEQDACRQEKAYYERMQR